MAKKNTNQGNTPITPGNKPVQARKPATAPPAPRDGMASPQKPSSWSHMDVGYQAAIVCCIALITWFFLRVSLDNQFTNWDDPSYIRDNAVIKNFSIEGLKNIFTTSIMGNYHPLTILSYAVDYHASGLDPYRYHLDSLLFHILVTILVYVFVSLLTHRPVAALITALLFGLHPMHVESVAWAAGRKDVVYGAFYMASCILWLYYIRCKTNKKWLWFLLALVLFIGSLLAKPVAVVLPVTLLLIDYYDKRKIDIRVLIEKIPLLAISIGFGIKSIKDQGVFGSLDTLNVSYNAIERIGLGGYALITYLWKAVVPASLSCYYPYPDKINGSLHLIYYLYPIGVAGALALFAYYMFTTNSITKTEAAEITIEIKSTSQSRIVVFGTMFFLVNIALLLQFIPVGGAIVADRYSYIAYLGLFIMAGWFVSSFFEPGANQQAGYGFLTLTICYALFLGYQSYQRCQVWYDAVSLWSDEIEKEPMRAPNAYNNLGFFYFNKFNESLNPAEKRRFYDSSFYLLNKSIELQPTFVNPYISLGELERTANNFPEAKRNYFKALSLKSFDEDANAYLGLAIIYAISKDFDSSAFCFRSALKLKPYFPEARSNYGNLLDMTNHPDSALVQYGIAISQNPDMYAPYLNRGRAYQRMHKCDEAMKDFEKALQISPDLGEIYYARSFCAAQKGDKPQALSDIRKAVSLGFNQISKEYYQAMGGK